MFEDLKSIISGASPLEVCKAGETTTRDLQLAVTAVFLTVVKADNRFGTRELETMFLSLCNELDIAESSVAELFEIAEFLIKEDANRLHKYIELVANKFSTDQKIRILGIAWKISVADGELAQKEVEIIAQLRKVLGLTMEQALFAQQQAMSEFK